MHHVAQENHPQRIEELAGKMRAFRASFDGLTQDDLHTLATDLVAHFERHTSPLDAAARKDVIRFLDSHRDALITLGSSMMFTGGLAFGSALTDKLWAGDMGYLLPVVGGWLFPAQHIFSVATDGSIQKFSQRVMQYAGKQAAGARIAMPAFNSPALEALSQKAKTLGSYAVEHRQQIISEWILLADTLVTAGWGHLAINGDPYAMASFVPGVFACMFHAVTVGQNYHRNYRQECKPEPTLFGMANHKMARALADKVQKLPEHVQPWMPGLSLATTQLMLAPSLMRGIEQGNVVEALGISSIMAGLCALYGGYMVPPVRQTLSKEDAALFRKQWGMLMQGYVQQRSVSDRGAEDMQRFSDAIDGLVFLKPIDRAALRDDTRNMLAATQDHEGRSWEQRVSGTRDLTQGRG